MISKPNASVVKGMIFAGCSFTWGQGLYYYSNLPSLDEPEPDRYDPSLIRETHLRFAEKIRFPRIVSQHFNQFDIVHPHNGGSNEGAAAWWRDCFNFRKENKFEHHPTYKLDYEDISHVFFQLTQWQRDNYRFTIHGKEFNIPFHAATQPENNDAFLAHLDEKKLTLEEWIDLYIKNGFENVKTFLQECEDRRIKTYVYTWPDTYIKLIEQDPWMSERFITFEYNGVNYPSIEDLMGVGCRHTKGLNHELTIKWDEDHFAVTPKDHHPSLTCHRVMAHNIIKRLEKDEWTPTNAV